MGDEEREDPTNPVDDDGISEVEGGEKVQGSPGISAPADDDIIIK